MGDSFRNKPFEDRKALHERLLAMNPERVPIIILRDKSGDSLAHVSEFKVLLPETYKVGNLMEMIRKDLKLQDDNSIFLFAGGRQLNLGSALATVYSNCRDKDGFLYVYYTNVATFGSQI